LRLIRRNPTTQAPGGIVGGVAAAAIYVGAVIVALAGTADAKPHPVVAAIAYACFHSDAPFSDGRESSKTTIDLVAAARTDDSTTVPPGDDKRPPSAPSNATHTHVVTKLDARAVQKLRAASDAVADGGPFKPEYPVPEGTSCVLQLVDAHGAAFVEIEKSDPKIDDAATRLVKLLL
jgi:hypothetical protein